MVLYLLGLGSASGALMVPTGGVAPPSRVYESLVLTLELRRLGGDLFGLLDQAEDTEA